MRIRELINDLSAMAGFDLFMKSGQMLAIKAGDYSQAGIEKRALIVMIVTALYSLETTAKQRLEYLMLVNETEENITKLCIEILLMT